jgi:hypothetical protein
MEAEGGRQERLSQMVHAYLNKVLREVEFPEVEPIVQDRMFVHVHRLKLRAELDKVDA